MSTPELEHHILMGVREGEFSDSGELELFRSVETLPTDAFGAIRAIRARCRFVNPDIIHAHSSYGGAYVRLAKLATKNLPIIYTPHGYSFERRDISRLQKVLFKTAERALAFNTTATAACSPRELELASNMRKSKQTFYVPNIAAPYVPSENGRTDSIPSPTVVVAAIGRLTPARDPLFFKETVRLMQAMNPGVEAVWIGGGEEEYASQLQAQGIRVTGWLDRQQLVNELANISLHIHTAAWDAFPMVLLEANAQRIPSLVRPIEAFVHLNDELTAGTPTEMAQKILAITSDASVRSSLLHHWDRELSENTRHIQRQRLHEVYGVAS